MNENALFALFLTSLAGLSTGIGSAIGLFSKMKNPKVLSFAMGFSAGVMIYISFVELMGEAIHSLSNDFGEKLGNTYAAMAFFAGIALIAIIDKLVPEFENPHEFDKTEDLKISENKLPKANKTQMMRVGVLTAFAIGIHNFPEGMATFASAMQNPSLGIAIAIAIAIHNIPEGLAVSVPIYYATGNRRKAFWLSFLSGLAEPIGAFVGYLILMPYLNDTMFGVIYAVIAGIMVFIALDQLLPAAEKFGSHHVSIYGLVGGMFVMALSLIMFM